MGPFSFPKNLSAKLPTFKKARPEPTPEQFEAAKQSLLSLSEALKGEHGTRIRMQKQGDAVQFQATDESWGKHVRKHSPSSSFKDVRKTNKQIRAIAHVLKFHPDENVKSAAGLLLDCHGKHRALPKNTNTLRSAVWDVKQALQPAEKPDYAHVIPDAEFKRLFSNEDTEDSSKPESESEQSESEFKSEQPKQSEQTEQSEQSEQSEQPEHPVTQPPGTEETKARKAWPVQVPGNFVTDDATAQYLRKNAALGAADSSTTAIHMLEVLVYLQKQSPNDLLLVTGEKISSHAGPIRADYEMGYRQLALRLQGLGMVYANYPESRQDAGEVRAAAKVLMEMSEPMLDSSDGVQGLRNSPELIKALGVIVEKCARRTDQPDIRAFYDSLAADVSSSPRPITLQQLQGDALRERDTVGKGAGEWKADRAAATELYKYLYCDQTEDIPGTSLNLVRTPSGESFMRHRNTFFLAPDFDNEEGIVRRTGIDPQAAQSAAKLVNGLGQQFATHPNKDVAAAGRDLMDIAAPVLSTDGTAQPGIRKSERLMNALATIALHGTPATGTVELRRPDIGTELEEASWPQRSAPTDRPTNPVLRSQGSQPVEQSPAPANPPLHRFHDPASLMRAIALLPDYAGATHYLADAASLLAKQHPGQTLGFNGEAICVPTEAIENDGICRTMRRDFALLIERIAKAHIGHPDTEVQQAGHELLAIASEALASPTQAIPNDERLRNALDVIALKEQNGRHLPAFRSYYLAVKDRETAS